MSDDPWLVLDPASFQVAGSPAIRFAVTSQDIGGGNRIPERAVPFRDGSKLDFIGGEARTFQIRALFHNDVTEPGLGDAPQMWPDRLDALEAAFATGKTGTLHLPWRRNVRCKARSWSRSAIADSDRGGEWLQVTFTEDNEESLDAAAIAGVSVRANASRLAEETVFDAESSGMWDGSFADLTQFAADVEGLLSAPGEFLGDLAHKTRRTRRACASIIESFQSRAEGRDQLNRPEGSRVERALLDLADAMGLAQYEAEGSLPPTGVYTAETDTDIWAIAAELGQNARSLISMNPELEDVGFIPAGTRVRVFA